MAVADSPTEGQPPSVVAAFARLQAQFVAGLPQRWQAIEAADTGPALEMVLHRLAGAGASYGLAPLGEAARLAETLARKAAMPGEDQPLREALADLRRQIDAIVTVR
jgi:HPt (histidine-containing phosphotransfer) domain-containing protein